MPKWIKFKDGQCPRKGEVIVVKSGNKIYEHLLIADTSTDFWRYPDVGHGTKLSLHGLTDWQLIESPY